ncbi:MAG TPA: hypothetical protein VMF50_06825 [Candidatus Binataceae bacterium]|nr:hypothetical protein [Candidatus Binataceae bacterium]
MIAEIGISEKPDWHSELKVFDSAGQQVATFKDSTFRKMSITMAVSCIPYCEAVLVADKAEAIKFIQVGNVIENWVGRAGQPETMSIRAVIEFVAARTGSEAEEGTAVIELQARSNVSSCMDSPFSGTGSGSLSDLVTTIIRPHQIRLQVETNVNKIEYFADVESAYAALLLLGLTFKAIVITDRDGQIRFLDLPTFLAEENEKPIKTIAGTDILGARMQQGRPVRRRDE